MNLIKFDLLRIFINNFIFFLYLVDNKREREDSLIKGTFYPFEGCDKNIQYIRTPHGRYQLYYNGFLYNRNMCSAQKTYW